MKMKHADRRSADDAPSARERFAAAFSAALDSDAASAASRTHRTHSSSHHHDGEGKSVHDKSVREREPAKKSGKASSSSGHHAPSGHHAHVITRHHTHAEPAPSGSKHAQLAGLGRSRGGSSNESRGLAPRTCQTATFEEAGSSLRMPRAPRVPRVPTQLCAAEGARVCIVTTRVHTGGRTGPRTRTSDAGSACCTGRNGRRRRTTMTITRRCWIRWRGAWTTWRARGTCA